MDAGGSSKQVMKTERETKMEVTVFLQANLRSDIPVSHILFVRNKPQVLPTLKWKNIETCEYQLMRRVIGSS